MSLHVYLNPVAHGARKVNAIMLLEIHMLQNFVPSNLNRDDTGSPKDCEFGGYRRARISSQCLKRAIRTAFKDQRMIPQSELAIRTKRVLVEVATRLEERGRPREQAAQAALALIMSVGLNFKNGLSEYLLFLSDSEIEAVVRTCDQYWEGLVQAAGQGDKANAAVPAEAKKQVEAALNGSSAADLALFGRMIADKPEFNVEAASQVAHAISTNRVSMEFDFYTAVDDLKRSDSAGADMLGTVEFNSATFYRYANLDVSALRQNLRDNKQLAEDTARAFMRAAVEAIPTGKQNSMAAHNKPSFVMLVVRTDAPCNLANAFLRPVQPGHEGDLMQASIKRLDEHWKKLTAMYGTSGVKYLGVATLEPEQLASLSNAVVKPSGDATQIDALIDWSVAVAFGRVLVPAMQE
jgi:CRISPR system Cascade subunit CasC